MLPGIHPTLGRVAVQCTRCCAKARVGVRVGVGVAIGVAVAAAVRAIARCGGGGHKCLTATLYIVTELIRLLAQDFVECLDQHEDGIVHERSLSLDEERQRDREGE